MHADSIESDTEYGEKTEQKYHSLTKASFPRGRQLSSTTSRKEDTKKVHLMPSPKAILTEGERVQP